MPARTGGQRNCRPLQVGSFVEGILKPRSPVGAGDSHFAFTEELIVGNAAGGKEGGAGGDFVLMDQVAVPGPGGHSLTAVDVASGCTAISRYGVGAPRVQEALIATPPTSVAAPVGGARAINGHIGGIEVRAIGVVAFLIHGQLPDHLQVFVIGPAFLGDGNTGFLEQAGVDVESAHAVVFCDCNQFAIDHAGLVDAFVELLGRVKFILGHERGQVG